jgi:pSer/pThr/pTyr-binding forkhead associated (FHA) protein
METTVRETIRKEKPIPDSRPPARPPSPSGVQVPGSGGSNGGMICPGTGGDRRSRRDAHAAEAAEQTVLESPVQKVFKKPSPLGGKSIHLVVVEGEDQGLKFDITGLGTYTIGRRECDIVLNDEKISRKHASVIIAREDQYAVADLASRNGTFINGVRLTRRNVTHNDLIRVGNTTIRFTVFNGPVAVES